MSSHKQEVRVRYCANAEMSDEDKMILNLLPWSSDASVSTNLRCSEDFQDHCSAWLRYQLSINGASLEWSLMELSYVYRECELCKEEFPAHTKRAKYCSDNCRVKAFRARKDKERKLATEVALIATEALHSLAVDALQRLQRHQVEEENFEQELRLSVAKEIKKMVKESKFTSWMAKQHSEMDQWN